MDCPTSVDLTLGEWGEELLKPLKGRRYPLGASFEVTERCNLSCIHCFINQPAGSREAAAREVTVAEANRIVDQMAEAGCTFLLLTGGEVMLRPDWMEIYRYAKRRGMLVSLFTNGTLLTRTVAEFLAEWRPVALEISLYGATEQTYERVTRVPGSYARFRQGLELALEKGLRLSLKSVLLTANRHELPAMRAFADACGLQFRYDGVVWPRLDGKRDAFDYRMSPAEVVALDRDDPERQREFDLLYQQFGAGAVRADRVYGCGAGVRSFHVDCAGRLSLCIMVRRPAYDLRGGSFREGWDGVLAAQVARRRELDTPCRTCTVGVLCTQCPGWSQLVNGDDETPVDYVCELGRLRAAHTVSTAAAVV